MPITVIPTSHAPKAHPAIASADSLDHLLQLSCPDTYLPNDTRIVASSFDVTGGSGTRIYPSSSSFVRAAIEAWGRHSHLVIRPEDVWFTILVQMNFFMQKNAESLRHLFVSHRGKKRIEVWGDDWPDVMDRFQDHLQAELQTEWMSDWVSPGFSTSTIDDERTATVLMMGLMKSFFDYAGGIICGIPSITILGTKSDWERLSSKIDRLDDFGDEPKAYAKRLRPILSRIVQTFDNPEAEETKEFWDQLVQAKVKHSNVCGEPPSQYVVSGWIMGLYYWDSEGTVNRVFAQGFPGEREFDLEKRQYAKEIRTMVQYDGVLYGEAALEDLPVGYAKAKFEMINEHGGDASKPFQGWVLAGSIGKRIVDGAPAGYERALQSSFSPTKSDVAGKSCSPTEPDVAGEPKNPGSFSGLLRSLNCFGAMGTSTSPSGSPQDVARGGEKQQVMGSATPDTPEHGHSTIQPTSGWFLFGPDKDTNPFVDFGEFDGPTVDAIDSCERVEHFGQCVNCRDLKHYKRSPPETVPK
ncbi:Uu.00g055060.m01.CDS01 [Anthostomella pinea]|uniref:Uu.00g055060.m01.CDS01 n=1 Tax=Anthostomella pinea TaxID=933095 RepID=A0AAI8VR13_9PEZI|nr:Uu.00g055060.m01.CDS01 [Anthostomella pinea]